MKYFVLTATAPGKGMDDIANVLTCPDETWQAYTLLKGIEGLRKDLNLNVTVWGGNTEEGTMTKLISGEEKMEDGTFSSIQELDGKIDALMAKRKLEAEDEADGEAAMEELRAIKLSPPL